jgi:phage baseplate assembly protein W
MANGFTYGIQFPFNDSREGKYLELTKLSESEIRTDLIHLILSRKGSRYFLPDFGTRLYEYIFEPMDGPTFSDIQDEIRDAVEEYIPGITIKNIEITDASNEDVNSGTYINENDERVFRVPGLETKEYTAKVKIDYIINDSAFNTSDFVIINI